jgi:cytochrome oxidase Cu insertion factor (SCO1/SenC/PrrC family)
MPIFAVRGTMVLAALAVAVLGFTTPSIADNPFDHIVPLVKVGDPLPATQFFDQRGRHVSFDEFQGNAVAVAFVYTHCRDACPLITRKFAQVRTSLGNGPFTLVEVTIDPAHDTPAAIAAYAREFHIDAPTWLIVTGKVGAVDDFNARMGVQAIASGRNEIIHNDRIVIVSPSGTVTDFIDGSSWTAADLAAQMQHVAGRNASVLNRLDLALGAAVAFCGGALSGRAGIGDLLASIAVFAAGIGGFVWLLRRTSSGRAS